MLILVRHGKAVSVSEWTGAEKNRPLTDEGRERTLRLAKGTLFVRERLTDPILYSSPYARARETADIIARVWKMQVVEEPIFSPGWGGEGLPNGWQKSDVIVVGHMPDMSLVLSALTNQGATINFRPPSMAIVKTNEEETKLLAYLSWNLF